MSQGIPENDLILTLDYSIAFTAKKKFMIFFFIECFGENVILILTLHREFV